MRKENEAALQKAYELSESIQRLMLEGNMELAHRSNAIYLSLMITILVTELVDGASDILDSMSAPELPEGTLLQ